MKASRKLAPVTVLGALLAFATGGAALGLAQAPAPGPTVSPAPVAPSRAPSTTTLPASTVPPPAPSLRLSAIAFFDPEHGYAYFTRTDGGNCTSLVGPTNDGGADFSSLVVVTSWPCDETAPATSLAFDDHGDGFLYGPGLFVTHDGGATWSPSDQPSQVLSVQALGESVWMVEAGCPAIGPHSPCPTGLLESSDGGRTWAPSPSLPTGADAPSSGEPALGQTWLVRLSELSAYLLANLGPVNGTTDLRLWFTGDGGASWVPRMSPCTGSPALSAVLSAAPDGTLWAVCAGEPSTGYQGKAVALSSDGGRTWATQANCLYVPPRVPPGCEALDFGYLGQVDAVSSTRAFLAGGRLPLLVTDDGGRRWVTTVPVLGDSGGGTGPVVIFDPADGFLLGDDPNNDEVPTLWVTADGADSGPPSCPAPREPPPPRPRAQVRATCPPVPPCSPR